MTTPSFTDGNAQPEYNEADFGHSEEAYALRNNISAIISDAGCDCGLGPTAAERDWTDLMSARPRADYNPINNIPEATLAVGVSADMYKYVVGPLQPPGIEDHALDRIRQHWERKAIEEVDNSASNLSKILKQLSGSWIGDDFDHLTELFEGAVKELNTFTDDGQEVCEVLDRQCEALDTLQGGPVGETPVPPAQFRHGEGSRLDKTNGTHMRPSFHAGPCKIITAEQAMDMNGIDSDFRDAVHEQVNVRTEQIMEERINAMSAGDLDSINQSEFIKQANDEARSELEDEIRAYEQEIQADYDAEVARIGDDITHRRNQADDVLHDSPFPVESRLGKGTPGETTLIDPPPPSTPDATGMTEPGGYTPATPASPDDVAARASTGSHSPATSPWAGGSDSEDEELSDGLSAGNSGGGAGVATGGGSTPTGPGSASPTGGTSGGMVGPGGRAGGGVTPGGAGRPGSGPGPGGRASSTGGGGAYGRGSGGSGAGSRGAGGGGRGAGGGMGMMGGQPGAAGQQGNQGNKNSAGRTLNSMGRTSPTGSGPAVGTGSNRATGTANTPPHNTGTGGRNTAGGPGAGTGRGAPGTGGMGLMGNSPNRGGSNKDTKSKGDDQTLNSMGRPTAKATPAATGPAAAPGGDTALAGAPSTPASKGANKLQNLIAAKKASEAKKNPTKKAEDDATESKPDNDTATLETTDYEDMDIHDQQVIEDDWWGAYNHNDDQYR